MPKGKKKIHELFSSKIATKRARREEVAKSAKPKVPESVDNFANNKPLFGPHKIRRLEAPVVQRKIAPTEGQATVNGKTGEEVKKLIHKPVPVGTKVDPTDGAIDAKPSEKPKAKRGRKPRTRRGTK